MWILASRLGAAVVGALTAAVAVSALYTFFTDSTPSTLEEASAQLDRIADAVETMVPGATDAATVERLQDRAIKVAEASFGGAEAAEAAIFKVTDGVFDISQGEVFDLALPNGNTVPIILAAGGTVFSTNTLVVNSVEYDLKVGQEAMIAVGGVTCRMLLVAGVSHDTSRFRWRCAGF